MQLQTLVLYGCNVTDASIAALSTLHSLSSLDLNQCAEVTDAGRCVDGSSRMTVPSRVERKGMPCTRLPALRQGSTRCVT